jgi:formamidopyrimidine-DNA glycosylase
MPELPEVETLRRGLARTLSGRRIVQAELIKPRIFSGQSGYRMENVIGATVEDVRRRAKYLILSLSNGLSVVVHLSLAGQIVVEQPDGERVAGGHPVPRYDAPLPHKQTSVIWRLDDGSVLFLTDIRQFAHLWIVPTPDVETVIPEERLGVEVVGDTFSVAELARRLRRRPRSRLKPVLLDQKVVAGLGNIYVDEALWKARLHPLQMVGGLTDEEIERLHDAIKEVVHLALTHGVARILNGKAVEGAMLPRIHGREGLPCLHCGQPIQKFRVAGRGTYICPRCQVEEEGAKTVR